MEVFFTTINDVPVMTLNSRYFSEGFFRSNHDRVQFNLPTNETTLTKELFLEALTKSNFVDKVYKVYLKNLTRFAAKARADLKEYQETRGEGDLQDRARMLSSLGSSLKEIRHLITTLQTEEAGLRSFKNSLGITEELLPKRLRLLSQFANADAQIVCKFIWERLLGHAVIDAFSRIYAFQTYIEDYDSYFNIYWPSDLNVFYRCADTGRRLSLGRLYDNHSYREEDGEYYEFFPEDNEEDEDSYDDSIIKEYGTNALDYLDFKRLPSEPKKSRQLYFGIELEVQVRSAYDLDSTAERVQTSLDGFVILCYDGSIDGDGFEIISAPATLGYHKGTAWDKFFDDTSKYVRGWTARSCGMHIHLSRNAFDSTLHLSKFVTFVNHKTNLAFVEDIAGRSSQHYAKLQHKDIGHDSLAQRDRYQAVNLENSDTVEVRIFQSNVAKAGFFKNLDFVAALFEYTCDCSLFGGMPMHHNTRKSKVGKQRTKHREGEYRSLLHADFISWVGLPSNRKKYNYLADWLVHRNYLKKTKKDKPEAKQLTQAEKENTICA